LFAGGALIGWLYDQDLIPVLVVFSVLIQLAALPILWKAGRRDRASSSP
jgi:hypothetical protein